MVTNKLMMILEKIMYGCVLNLTWIIGTIIGLGIFGIGPATYALAKTLSQKEHFDNQASLIKICGIFFKEYKASFFKANGVFLIYLFIISILIINFRIVMTNQMLKSIFIVPLVLMLLYAISTLLTSVVVSVTTIGNFKEKMKLTLLSPLIVPSLFVFNIVFLCCIAAMVYIIPITLVLISITILTTGILFINIHKLQNKKLVINQNL